MVAPIRYRPTRLSAAPREGTHATPHHSSTDSTCVWCGLHGIGPAAFAAFISQIACALGSGRLGELQVVLGDSSGHGPDVYAFPQAQTQCYWRFPGGMLWFLCCVRTVSDGVVHDSCVDSPLRADDRFQMVWVVLPVDDAFMSSRRTSQDAHSARLARVRDACTVLANAKGNGAVARAQHASGLSEAQFRRVFKQVVGVTPKKYQQAIRRINLHSALADARSIDAAIVDAGFESPSRVYDEVNHLLGMSPSAFQSGAPGEVIRFSTESSDLGVVLVALTARGICAVLLGETPRELEGQLASRFPRAILHEDHTLGEYLEIVLAMIKTPGIGCTLPLDVRGTAFQELVWEHLRRITPGTTQNYSEVARSIGKPSASRAVARACGSNTIAVAVPCHRVVGSDGQLRGFRWGIDRKAELLRRERREEQGDE